MKKYSLFLLIIACSLRASAQVGNTFPGVDTIKQKLMPVLTDSSTYLISSRWFKQQPRVIPSDSGKYFYPYWTNPKAYLTANQVSTWTGDVTGSGATGGVLTIANVNSFPGKYGSSNQVGAFQTNAKGQVIWDSLINIAFPVTTVFGRTGAIVLLSSDVTAALGYTPLNSSTGVTTFNGSSGAITYNPTLQTVTNNGSSTTNSISINALNTNMGTSNYHWAMYANGYPAFAHYLVNAQGFNNTGADYAIQRYDSVGNAIDRPFFIRRSTGGVVIKDSLTVNGNTLSNGNITLPTGTLVATLIGSNYYTSNNGTATGNGAIHFQYKTGGVARWTWVLQNAEIGSNTGSDLFLTRANDAGTFIDEPFGLTRSTGRAAFNDGLDVYGTGSFSQALTLGSTININNNTAVVWRNVQNSANISGVYVDGSNHLDFINGNNNLDSAGNLTIQKNLTAVGATLTGLNSAGFVQTNSSGVLSTAALTSGQVTTALGYTPMRIDGTGQTGIINMSLNGNSVVNGTGTYAIWFTNFAPGASEGFKVDFTNNHSDAGWDMFTKDSATGYWNRIPKGTWHQILQMGSSGPTWVNLVEPNRAHSVFVPTNGGTVTLVDNGYNVINPSGTLASLTFNLPSSPSDGDFIEIKFVQTISSSTFSGASIALSPNTTSGSYVKMVWDAATSKWY